ncbi:MAG: channel, inward rectifier [Phenylobacterium sp.]|nr:channel, inward rectifier [Phenylobacterium sp.]
MVRVASRRLQGISEPRARISYLRDQAVGELRFRRFDELKLVRDNIPVLSLSWTLIHPIDEDSPLFGMSDARLAAEAPTLMVSVAGFDEAISSTVNDRKTYDPEDIRFGHVFTNILRDLPGGFVELDITRIHETTPIETPDQESAVRAS